MNIYDYESLILNAKTKARKPLEKQTVCFTGKSSYVRQELEQMVIDAGGTPKDRVIKTLNYLVYAQGDKNSKYTSKYYLAEDYGVKIISELEFMELIRK